MNNIRLLLVGDPPVAKAIESFYKNYQDIELQIIPSSEAYKGIKNIEKYFESFNPNTFICALTSWGSLYQSNSFSKVKDASNNSIGIIKGIQYCCQRYEVEKFICFVPYFIYPLKGTLLRKEDEIYEGPLVEYETYEALDWISIVATNNYLGQIRKGHYISIICPNIYGPGFEGKSNTIQEIIDLVYKAKIENKDSCLIPGIPDVRREYISVYDLATLSLMLLRTYVASGPVNASTGQVVDNLWIANFVAKKLKYGGKIVIRETSNTSKAPNYRLDNRITNSGGWMPGVRIDEGIEELCKIKAVYL